MIALDPHIRGEFLESGLPIVIIAAEREYVLCVDGDGVMQSVLMQDIRVHWRYTDRWVDVDLEGNIVPDVTMASGREWSSNE